MSDKPIKPLDKYTVDRIIEMLWNDIEIFPREYRRDKIYAAYHRAVWLIDGDGKQTPWIEAEEEKAMRAYRKDGVSYHNIAFIFRRSTSTVGHKLKDLILDEIVSKL